MRAVAAVFAGTTLVAVIVAANLWQQLCTDRLEMALLRQQMTQLETQRPTPGAIPGLVATPFIATAPAPPAAAPSVLPVSVPASAVVLADLSSCEGQKAQIRQAVSRIPASLAAELNLNASEGETFIDILTRQVAVVAPACRTDSAQDVSPEALQAELAAFLGPVRLEQFQDYQARQLARQNMATLRGQLEGIGAPLDEHQGSQLLATIEAENRRSRAILGFSTPPAEARARLAYEEQSVRVTEERFERVLNSAQAYLNPQQLTLLKGNMERQTSEMKTQLAQMRASVEAGRGIPPPGPVFIAPR